MNRSFSLNREHACDVRSLTIQQKTHIGFALVTTLLALLCGTIIWGSFRQYRQENADLQSFEFVRGAIVAANVISAERGPTNDLLVRLQNDGAAERRNLLAARTRSDQALARFSAGIVQATTLDERERDNLLHALDTIRITLADARSEVDALDARPLASRTVHDIQHAQARLFRIVDAVSLLIDGAMTDTAMRDPHTSGAILLARLLGDLREYAGRTGSLLIAPMFARQALDRAQFADIMRMRGRIEQLRALIDGAIGAQFDDPDVVREYAQLDDAFDGHLLPLVDATVAAGQTGAYATSAADFSRTIVPYFRPSELLRDRIIDLARRRAIADRDAARIKVVVSALATALCIAILFSLARATQRLLSQPLDALGRRIIALSDGDTAHVSIPRGVAPEIARIHEALETLRNAYVRRDMLERQRNDMLTLFSHDMRAPLTSLIILIATQEQRAGETQMKRQFARIGKLARHTLAMADGFAQLSRAEASEYERVPVNLADLMNEARDAVWPLAHQKHMSIDDVPRRDDAIVLGDPALLSRALINLLDNAIKYSASLTSVECRVEPDADGKTVRCTIRDSGCGIGSADQARLFERYRRFRTAGQPETSGVGLGMAFVKAVVERHAGSIQVHSVVLQGTTVTITLPAAANA
ncbi:ATPase [Burkholderia stabilis]|uniref:sensor histidine kinase n=1 Tax=Burkholderia stabilis TaxID=95485 RepID=UPI000851787E|nr:HAMP domain-containing sensor histidine kinase [Burkholderia stabilis]AOR70221.1 ATPase [Burkholderia stabilis]HDR9489398.1 HAMP domain-containing histidine kinase [Burkholderia stabilis]HDR9527039.1 HAMP domain-containing histidine kinase [Burkholderia stabilis]HDR9534371.1 HAMP domain-containing histidine kinase [Burkholderia stabilis]HDR9535556.1 HAMP domain-containing histidine kinase [Burkholderia stabilis]